MIVDDFEIVNALVCDDVRHESDGPLPDSDPDRENHGCFEDF